MPIHDSIQLLVRRDGARVCLCSPDVGIYTNAAPRGRALQPGDTLGVLITLGRARALILPAGAAGLAGSDAPERVHCPVGYGDVLCELAPLVASAASAASGGAADAGTFGAGDARHRHPGAHDDAGALVFRAPTAGRFWHRAAPGEPPLVGAGAVVEEGKALGLIEVMKTFSQVLYRAKGGLPARARIARVLAADGADVDEDQPLFELEPST